MKPVTPALLLAGLATLASACGGGSDTPAGPPSKAEYVRQANAICVQLGVAAEELARTTFGEEPRARGQLNAYSSASERIEAGKLAELRALQPPAGDAATVAAIYDAMERALGSIPPPGAGPGTAAREPAALTAFQRRAGAYGLTNCAAG